MPDSSCLFLFGGILLVAVALTVYACRRLFQNRLLRQAPEAVALVHEKQNEMLRAALRIRDQALAFISWELHEETCQVLAMSGTLLLDAVGSSNDQVIQHKTVQAIAERLFAKLCGIFQDALKHILRQTSADVVHIDLSSFNDSLYPVFVYNGKEFNPEGAYPAKTGIIREMAALSSATVSFETSGHLCNKMVIKLGMGGVIS